MEIHFSKYEGAGNDFVVIDMTSSTLHLTSEQLQRMCNRKMGVGADGVLVLQESCVPGCKFKLVHYTADGNVGSFCGNGSRCSLAFAEQIGLVDVEEGSRLEVEFEACDGVHAAGKLHSSSAAADTYFVDIKDVALATVRRLDEDNYFLDTGSPHHVRFVPAGTLALTDVARVGREVRWGAPYGQQGTNVNFVEEEEASDSSGTPASGIWVRTFERGVEDETLACGTGVTASAIAAFLRHRDREETVTLTTGCCAASASTSMTTRGVTKGGALTVSFRVEGETCSGIRLCGSARRVFDGKMVI